MTYHVQVRESLTGITFTFFCQVQLMSHAVRETLTTTKKDHILVYSSWYAREVEGIRKGCQEGRHA